MRRWPDRPRRPDGLALVAWACLALLPGCGRGPETSYGSLRGDSLNGTGAFAELLRRSGHQVRPAWRLTDDLARWADVIVRFAATPGPPDEDEADWYGDWLESDSDRCLIYVVRDYDAQAEYWKLVLERLGPDAEPERLEEAEANRDRASGWVSRLPRQAEDPADAESWFAIAPAVEPPRICKTLEGEFAEGVDAAAAAITVHAPLKAGPENVLLKGDGKDLAIEWATESGSRVLALANGSFLLNLPLANPHRRSLTARVAGWLGEGPRRIAFIEGYSPLGRAESPPTLWDLIRRIDGFRWAALQFGLFGVLACLARAPRLGRPRPEPPSDADRPAAHAEALGALLRRSRTPARARDLLAQYRRWRFPRSAEKEAADRK